MRATVLWVGLLVGLGCSQPAVEESAPPTEEATAALTDIQRRGETIYHAICWSCHGHGGHGDGPAVAQLDGRPPPTFHTPDFAEADGDRLARAFRSGLLTEQDPTYPHYSHVLPLLDLDYLADVMAYISLLSEPASIPGSAMSGKELYDEYCLTCHGPDGHGFGPARDIFVDLTPSDLTTNPLVVAEDWDGLYEDLHSGASRVHRANMPAWGEMLESAELWDLVAYISTL